MADDLDDEYEEGEGEGESGGGGKRKKLLLIVILAVLLVIGALAGAYFAGLADPLLGGGKKDDAAAPAAGEAHGGGGAPGTVQAAVFYDLPEMLVDLNTQGRKRTFLKIRVSLELASPADTPTVESVMPRIIDNFQVYLRELRLEDLQGAAGVYRLREELLVRVNQAVRPAKVNDVLFKDMLIQ
ncbi:flagellar basal body-associated FliL family protein [Insolitispirillum peregrinum]|uniref:flagellar basal body-associated FliL family protein n=1 Tax=Insolitispirillum peregrinum TaxID=80876 RepID=UPI0036135918